MHLNQSGCEDNSCQSHSTQLFQDKTVIPSQQEACCGPSATPGGRPHERPGYTLCHFVDDILNTQSGAVPKVKTTLDRTDLWISIMARSGVRRNRLKVAPGLYAVGNPESDSPVLVTANYMLSFNILRSALKVTDAWILVLDTRGINVWCAAGKGTFSDQEVVLQVKRARLDQVVNHRELILPQLSATGVDAKAVKKACGFRVKWGPVRAEDINAFLSNGKRAASHVRRVTFTMPERLVLIPVEIYYLFKPSLWILAAIFILSGIGYQVFSFSASWSRGLQVVLSYGVGILGGAVLVPMLLPWIPGKAFSFKGALIGLLTGGAVCWLFWDKTLRLESIALLLFSAAVSSYLAMNFTGATPFTSPSGVEKEMRKAIPAQALSVLVAAVAWVTSGFMG